MGKILPKRFLFCKATFPMVLGKSSRLFIELSLSVSLGSSGLEACAENLVLDIWKE